jgi:serine protease
MCLEVIMRRPRRDQPWRALFCAALFTLGTTHASAQTVDEPDRPAEPLERYRNGADWIEVRRTGTSVSGLTLVELSGGGHVFHAEIDGHAIIQLRPDADQAALLRRERLRLVRPLSAAARLVLVESANDSQDGLHIAQRLAAADGIAEAQPDLHLVRVRHAISIPPNDPRYTGQWYLKKIQIEKAWRLSTGDRATKVVVVDDGCDLQHPDLREKLEGGLDLVDMDDDPSYQTGARNNAHGTMCAGLVGAHTDNDEGIAGVCPECTLSCVRLLPGDDDKAVPVSNDLRAFDYALMSGASVVSNSWGFAETVPAPAALRSLLELLYDEGRDGLGILVVFAAGNENRVIQANEVAAIRGVLTVGASTNFDEAAPFSNQGASLGVTAPAGTVTTDISGPEGMGDGDYTTSFGGTSSACPVVAGVAGLVMSARADMTAADVRELLEKTARPAPYAEPDSAGHDTTYGYGIVNASAALHEALGVEEEPDAESDAGASDRPDASQDPGKADSGGCAVAGGGGHAALLSWLGLCLWMWMRRRRVNA